jgi:hypothetical protein
MMKGLYITACVLMLFAIGAAGMMQYHAGLAATTMAKATAKQARTGTHPGLDGAKATAVQHARMSDQYGTNGLVLAGLGIISWVVSLFAQRRNRVAVPVVLLIIYITTCLLMV